MKMNKFGIVAIFTIAVVGCKEKPKPVNVDKPAEVAIVEEPGEVNKKPEEVKKEKIVLSPEERAAKTGFAKYLPAETEMFLSVYQAKESYEKLKALKAVGVFQMEKSRIEKELGIGGDDLLLEDLEFEQGDEDDFAGEFPEDEMADGSGPWTLLGQEVTIAFGETSGEQLGHLLKMNERISFFQAAAFGKAMQALLKNGDMEEFTELLFYGDMQSQSFVKFLEDPESGIPLLDKTVFPPMYIAFRAKEGELDQAARMIASSMAFFGMAGEMAVPVEIETGGSKFNGYKLLGAKIAELMIDSGGDSESKMKKETFDALMSTLAKKNLIFATGTIGDHVVLMIGGDEDSFKLVADPKESLGGSEKMNFVDEFSDKPFLTVSYGDQKALGTLIDQAGGAANYALGFREGISGGELRDIEEMLYLFAEREKALLKMTTTSTHGMVAYLDEGLKIDSFGGYDKGAVDWSAPTRLAHLGDDADQFLFINYPSNAAYNEQASEYLELFAETAYAMAMKFSALDIEDPEMARMKDYLKFFDVEFREHTLGLYQAVSGDLMDGLGQETAFLIDMKGSLPAVPGIPQEFVNKGKGPRLAMVSPVRDREKIGKAWEKINTHSTALLAKVSEMAEQKMPMPKPIPIEKDGEVAWFLALPFFQDDFVPSVTLNDDWFVASTSKNQGSELIHKAKAGGDTGQGIKIRINFNVLSDYSEDMLKLVENDVEAFIKDEDARNNFTTNKSSISKMIEATREFESMTWDVRKEDDLVRSRIHFKMN